MNPGEHLVIVGGGPAGLATARAYRETGGRARVTILTSEPYAPYNRPPLTKEFLRGEASHEDLPLESDGWYGENDVELRLSTVVAGLNRNSQTVELDDGEELSYDACVLATGSEPIRLPIPGADDPEILVMRTVENSTRLQDRVGENGRSVVVGSGFIGCEAAASLALRGGDVTLVSLEESPQQDRLGQEVGERIEGWLRDYGVNLRLGASLESIERSDSGYELSIEGAGTISAGTVLFGTGVAPRTGLAEEAGLEVDGGVITDSSMRTSAPGIYRGRGHRQSVQRVRRASPQRRALGRCAGARAYRWDRDLRRRSRVENGPRILVHDRRQDPQVLGLGRRLGRTCLRGQRRSLHGLVRQGRNARRRPLPQLGRRLRARTRSHRTGRAFPG